MTKAHVQLSDNDGRCESCNKDGGGRQSKVPVFLGTMGMGSMWKCQDCIEKAGGRAAIDKKAEAEAQKFYDKMRAERAARAMAPESHCPHCKRPY